MLLHHVLFVCFNVKLRKTLLSRVLNGIFAQGNLVEKKEKKKQFQDVKSNTIHRRHFICYRNSLPKNSFKRFIIICGNVAQGRSQVQVGCIMHMLCVSFFLFKLIKFLITILLTVHPHTIAWIFMLIFLFLFSINLMQNFRQHCSMHLTH